MPALKPDPAPRADYWARVRDGIGHLWGQPVIRRTVTTLFAAAMFGSAEAVLGVVLAVSVLNVGATGFGVLEGALALGAVLSTFLVPPLTARMPRERLFLMSLLVFGLVEAFIGAWPTFGWALAAYLVSGALNMLFLIPARSLLQLHTPAELPARVFAAFGAVMQSAVVIGTCWAARWRSRWARHGSLSSPG
ncbi:MAG: MFS transporter [Anaerolineales bacterium]